LTSGLTIKSVLLDEKLAAMLGLFTLAELIVFVIWLELLVDRMLVVFFLLLLFKLVPPEEAGPGELGVLAQLTPVAIVSDFSVVAGTMALMLGTSLELGCCELGTSLCDWDK
jgi:hypothetical protein